MIVGVPKEIKRDEYRVAMLPVGVEELVRAGHRVLVEHGAGLGSGLPDEAYHETGGRIGRPGRRGLRPGGNDPQGQRAAAARVAAAASGPDRIYLFPFRRGSPADRSRAGLRRPRPPLTKPCATIKDVCRC